MEVEGQTKGKGGGRWQRSTPARAGQKNRFKTAHSQ